MVTGLLGIDRLRRIRGADRTTTRLEALALPIADAEVTSRDEMVVDLLTRLEGGQVARAVVRGDDSADGGIVGLVTPEDIARAIEMGSTARFRGRPSGTLGRPRQAARTLCCPDDHGQTAHAQSDWLSAVTSW